MAAHNHSSGVVRHSSSSATTEPPRTKRSRTKHACDECRRSQKKCDGDRPVCRRCFLNGTRCNYTPHKSRSHCACIGQDETRRDGPIPDVYVFPNTPSSFLTWSTASSPEQSPTTTVLETPSPTFLTHDDMFDSPRNGTLPPVSDTFQLQPPQHQSSFHRNQLYTQRSYSVPNISTTTTVAPSPRIAYATPPILTSSLPQYSLDPSPIHHHPQEAYPHVYAAVQQNRHQYDSSPASTYSDLLIPHLSHETAASMLDFAPHYNPHLSDVDLSHSLSPFYGSDGSPVSQGLPPFDSPASTHHSAQEQQLLESYEINAPPPSAGFGHTPGLFSSNLLLEHPTPPGHQQASIYQEASGPYAAPSVQRSSQPPQLPQIETTFQFDQPPMLTPADFTQSPVESPAPSTTPSENGHAQAQTPVGIHSQSRHHSPIHQEHVALEHTSRSYPQQGIVLPPLSLQTQQTPRWSDDVSHVQTSSPVSYNTFDLYDWPQ